MESLFTKVRDITLTLDSCRAKFESHDEDARLEIGSQVFSVRCILTAMEMRIEQDCVAVDEFMQIIEGPLGLEWVSLKPKLSWLSKRVAMAMSDLDAAETKATDAMHSATSFQLQVRDVNQDISIQQREMEKTSDQTVEVMEEADDNLAAAQRQIEDAREEVSSIGEEIQEHVRKIEGFQSDLKERETALNRVSKELATAQRTGRKCKRNAFLGAVSGPRLPYRCNAGVKHIRVQL